MVVPFAEPSDGEAIAERRRLASLHARLADIRAGIPVVEVPSMTWRDQPLLVVDPASIASTQIIVVGDAKYFKLRVEASQEVRRIVREGLSDVIEWLASNNRYV